MPVGVQPERRRHVGHEVKARGALPQSKGEVRVRLAHHRGDVLRREHRPHVAREVPRAHEERPLERDALAQRRRIRAERGGARIGLRELRVDRVQGALDRVVELRRLVAHSLEVLLDLALREPPGQLAGPLAVPSLDLGRDLRRQVIGGVAPARRPAPLGAPLPSAASGGADEVIAVAGERLVHLVEEIARKGVAGVGHRAAHLLARVARKGRDLGHEADMVVIVGPP